MEALPSSLNIICIAVALQGLHFEPCEKHTVIGGVPLREVSNQIGLMKDKGVKWRNKEVKRLIPTQAPPLSLETGSSLPSPSTMQFSNNI